jgi:quinoprotein glucose dehydrogenase
MNSTVSLCLGICLVGFLAGCGKIENVQKRSDYNNYKDWGIYRGDQGANQFSELDQINTGNVHLLEPVWQFNTGDHTDHSVFQNNPLMIDGFLYIVSPGGRVMALDAETGREIWDFDARTQAQINNNYSVVSRGLTYFEEDGEGRLFYTMEMSLYAINAKTGRLVDSFGKAGIVDLGENMDAGDTPVSVSATTPGVIFEDFYILGMRTGETFGSSPGHIRAWDARTGEFRWIFHTIPQEGEFGFDTWKWVEGETYGGANPWGGLTVDEARGWVFAGVGSPTYDFYGANRHGENLFGNCVLALDARTGKRVWHYQTVHHDIWDMDNPPSPILVTLNDQGYPRDAVVQMTKQGWMFILDRNTGVPIFPVEERPVPPSSIPGEEAWPTQPYPSKPPALVRQGFSADDLSDVTPEIHAYVSEVYQKYKGVPMYTPFSLEPQVLLPGMSGGMEWHGASFDPHSQILYVNVNEMPNLIDMVPITTLVDDTGLSLENKGRLLYQANCIACHGVALQGAPPVIPSLQDLSARSDLDLLTSIRLGKGTMPPFRNLPADDINAVLAFLRDPSDKPMDRMSRPTKTVYLMDGYKRFFDDQGHPAIKPPWGSLAAVDLNKGEIKWKVPLGEYPDLVAKGIRNTGSLNWGGAVATSGGVVFIGATADEKMRAFDSATGKVLWEYKMPYAGNATPAIFELNGKQFVVICAGGGPKTPATSGDAVVAFALPE